MIDPTHYVRPLPDPIPSVVTVGEVVCGATDTRYHTNVPGLATCAACRAWLQAQAREGEK